MPRKAKTGGRVIDLMAALKASLAKQQRCERCAGRGTVMLTTDQGYDYAECDTCDGHGWIDKNPEAPDARA